MNSFPIALARGLAADLLAHSSRCSLLPVRILAVLAVRPESTRADLGTIIGGMNAALGKPIATLIALGYVRAGKPLPELGNPIPLAISDKGRRKLSAFSPTWHADLRLLEQFMDVLTEGKRTHTPFLLQVAAELAARPGSTSTEICHALGRDRTTNGGVRKILALLLDTARATRADDGTYRLTP